MHVPRDIVFHINLVFIIIICSLIFEFTAMHWSSWERMRGRVEYSRHDGVLRI